jgi:hypothetical protein
MLFGSRNRTVDLLPPEETTMTVDTIRSSCPNIFDAGLSTIAYHNAPNPDDAHRIIRRPWQQAPIALGPHGPEMLTYDRVRTVLRDPRFCMPRGFGLEAQRITSAPLWNRVVKGLLSLDGVAHHRLRQFRVTSVDTPGGRTATYGDRGGHRRVGRSATHGSTANELPMVGMALVGASQELRWRGVSWS